MRIVLCGIGVVGKALLQLLLDDRRWLADHHGFAPRIVGAADSRGVAASKNGLDLLGLLSLKARTGSVGTGPIPDLPQFIADTDADVFVQAVPTNVRNPTDAIDQCRAAIHSGKHIVTATKSPLACAMASLKDAAAAHRVRFGYSATVGAGTPMLALAARCALGDRVTRIEGVVNGTTNYILTAMENKGETFEAALLQAQKLGFAETDPSADVDGLDTACKTVILANEAMHRRAVFTDVRIDGIRHVTPDWIGQAASAGRRIKLVGRADEHGLSVAPREVPIGSPLDVPGTTNALCISLERGGDVTLTGRGAGGFDTASAILRDLLDVWRSMRGE
jgi:homoserine dehydrogenase